MAKTKSIDAPFRKGEKVVATVPLPGVPEGTKGKVKLVNGLSWTRYWVFFENGVDLGSIDNSVLVRAKDWEAYKARREYELANPAAASAATNGDAAPAPAAPPGNSAIASQAPAYPSPITARRALSSHPVGSDPSPRADRPAAARCSTAR